MSGGFWFAICIPTEEYEKKLNEGAYPEKDVEEGVKIIVTNGEKVGKDENGERKESEGNIYTSLEEIRRRKHKKETTVMFVDETSDSPTGTEEMEMEESLVKLLKEALELLGIYDAAWSLSEDKNYHQVYFPCEPGVRCDYVLETLAERGIGMRSKSTIGVIPCAVFYRDVETEERIFPEEDEKDSGSEESTETKPKSDFRKAFKSFRSLQRQFLKSVTARLTVAQVVEGVRANSTLTFDFMMFTVLASMIAALGLMENSSVVLVASMLISPLMGPILAGTFGAVIQDKPLRNLGIKVEIVGLILCLSFGFLFGLICASFSSEWGQGDWPTTEMAARGQLRSLWVGALIALPSGAGVALSVLGGNAGSLVGVAISASLLPPAVNAGLLWALSVVKLQKSLTEHEIPITLNSTTFTKPSLVPPDLYEISYYESMDKECAVLGVVSLLLTLINILCIFLMAVLVLKIKEVAPRTAAPQTSRFWKEDLKIARDYNKTYSSAEGRELGKEFLDEWTNLSLTDSSVQSRVSQYNIFRNIVSDAELDPVYQTVVRCMPTARPISQRLSVIPEKEVRRHLFDSEVGGADPTYAMTVAAAPANRRHTYLTFENEEKPKQKRTKTQSYLENGVSSRTVMDISTDPDLRGIQLRRAQPSKNNRRTGLFRHSLLPSSAEIPRFQVTPVVEEKSEESPALSTKEQFIQKESSC